MSIFICLYKPHINNNGNGMGCCDFGIYKKKAYDAMSWEMCLTDAYQEASFKNLQNILRIRTSVA